MFIKIKDKTINFNFVDCFSIEENSILFSSINGYIHEVVCESPKEAIDLCAAVNLIICNGQMRQEGQILTKH